MVETLTRVCEHCERPLSGEPLSFEGRVYCCAGCAGGGPCACIDVSPARPVIVRAGGFVTQVELLDFALDLERHPAVAEVALMRGDLEDAWFAVTAASGGTVHAALVTLPGFEVTVEPSTVSLAVTVRRAGAPGERPAPTPASAEVAASSGTERGDEPSAAPAPAPAAAVAVAPAAAPTPTPALAATARLRRNRDRGVLGGVCAGIADRRGYDLPLIRAVTVLLTVATGGLAAIAYLALWWRLPLSARADAGESQDR